MAAEDIGDTQTMRTKWSQTLAKWKYRVCILTLTALLLGCSPAAPPTVELNRGASKDEVIAAFGEPDRTQDFILPDQPFFGPQEGLVDLVPAGTLIEEWVYEMGDEVLYVWFTGENGEARRDWRLLETARHPNDAVY